MNLLLPYVVAGFMTGLIIRALAIVVGLTK